MKKQKSLLVCIFQIVTGALLLTNPDFGSAVVSNILGWLLVVFGGLALVYGLLKKAGIVWDIVSALVVVIGGVMLWNPLMLARVLGILLGLFLAFQGLTALSAALKVRRNGGNAGAALVLAILLLVLGLVLMFLPLTTSRLLMTVAGIIFTASGVIGLLIRAKTDRLQESNDSNIVDADP